MTNKEILSRAVTVVASIIGPPLAAFVALAGAIQWSGCFIECSEGHPDHLGGGLLVLLAVVLLLAAPLLAAALVRRGTWVAATIAVPVVEVGVLLGR